MKALALVLLVVAACGLQIDPGGSCAQVCAPYGVCSYQGQGGNGGADGTCTCKDRDGWCPGDPDPASPSDAGKDG